MYKVINRFVDLKDGGHVYNVGDIFPRTGIRVDDKRLEELSSNRNRRGVALITGGAGNGLSEVKEDAMTAEAGVSPSGVLEAKEKPRKGRKKNARTGSELHS